MTGVFRVKAIAIVVLMLLSVNSSIAFTISNESEYFGVPSPLLSVSGNPEGGVVAKTVADMDSWKRTLLEEASRYRGSPGIADGAAFMNGVSMASPLLAVSDKQSQPMRNENERQAFCAYVSNDYTEQMGKMLQRLEASCRGKKRDDKQHANQCEVARSASRQFLNIIQLIQHSVCPDLGLF